MTILLLEPDTVLAHTYQQALQLEGHQVVVAGTAQRAIHVADKLKPDIVLLELQLVSHSGIEFLYEFRSYEDWQSVPAIVLSHVPPAEFLKTGVLLQRDLGVQKYLYKPQTSLRLLQQTIRDFATVKS